MPKIPDCDRCYFRAYNQPIVCAVHPAGPDDDSCLDFKLDPTAYAHLLTFEDDKGPRKFILERLVYSVGRATQCDIRLYSRYVSRRHGTLLQLRREDGTNYYRLVDGNSEGQRSLNGILINGRKLEFHDLQNGDEIFFGPRVRAKYYRVLQVVLYGELSLELEQPSRLYPLL